MVYHCFLDDSKDENQSKLMLSAGFFGTIDDWGSLRIAWSRKLKEHGLEYFKSTEHHWLKEQFAKFKSKTYPIPTGREKADQIRAELQEILRHHPGIRGVGVAIPVEDYGRVCARPETNGILPRNPYHAALVSVVFEAVKIVRKKSGRNMVAFVHDAEDNFPELWAVYKMFAKSNPKTAKFMGGFQPLDDKLHPPLQAADMVANYTLGLGLEGLAAGNLKAHLTEMKQNIHLLGIWSEH